MRQPLIAGKRVATGVALLVGWLPWVGLAQRQTGELRLEVVDATGAPLPASGRLTSLGVHVQRDFAAGPDGRVSLTGLPFGLYRLAVSRSGFAPYEAAIEMRSAVPATRQVVLSVVPVQTSLTVNENLTLLQPPRTGSEQYLGREALSERRATAPGRSTAELVNSQPGWLLEANGILHPRGSEYEVQYVVDGLPLFDNRSPAFAQGLEADEFASMRVLTGGYPAEYGRKLGGVVEVNTERDTQEGARGTLILSGGSFATRTGYAFGQYRRGKTAWGLSAEGSLTDRYLDSPVEANYTNHGFSSGFSARAEHEASDRDRTRVYVYHHRAGFLVPNERIQEEAGQRQDRNAVETLGQVSHEHVFSPRVLALLQGRVRDTSVGLWSNALSTPIQPTQSRGFREGYANASLSVHRGSHEWKFGGEGLFSSVQEQFGFNITAYRVQGVRIFDRDLPSMFRFADRAQNREQSAYAQDLIRWKGITGSLGLRYDHYRLRVDEHAVSPRLGVAYQVPRTAITLRAAYDRVFQTPAIENVLLSSANLVSVLGGEGAWLPLKPSRGTFLEAGFSRPLLGRMRLDATWFRRRLENFADDSLLLNTGVSFPIAFASGQVEGVEVKLEMPRWGPLSGFVSYGNLVGHGELPVAGGLFLGDDVAQLLQSRGRFAISQDQRNTARTRLRGQLGPRAWAALSGRYNSGLPVELEGSTASRSLWLAQYGAAVLERVNFTRERVRPSYTVDLGGGIEIWRRERHRMTLQADVLNLTDRLNVINFAGLFSGTALEPRRSASVRLRAEF